MSDAPDRTIRPDEDDVERDQSVLHPEGHLLRRLIREYHPAITRKRFAEHKAAFLLILGARHFNREAMIPVRRMNRQRRLWQTGLRLLVGRNVLRRRFRTARDEDRGGSGG